MNLLAVKRKPGKHHHVMAEMKNDTGKAKNSRAK
jgi:hypothetical protein